MRKIIDWIKKLTPPKCDVCCLHWYSRGEYPYRKINCKGSPEYKVITCYICCRCGTLSRYDQSPVPTSTVHYRNTDYEK